MTVHHIKIKKEALDPATVTVKYGDQIKFQLSGRADPAIINIGGGMLFADGNAFQVNTGGQEKIIISKPPSETRYTLMATKSTAENGEVVIREQTGTMTGSITVVP